MLEGLEGAAGFEDGSPKEDKTGSGCVCVRARGWLVGWQRRCLERGNTAGWPATLISVGNFALSSATRRSRL